MKRREYSLIAKAYAHALFATAKKQGTLEVIQHEAKELGASLAATPRLSVFLHSPQIATEKKLALVEKVFKERFNPAMLKMLALLIQRERTRHLGDVLSLLDELIDEASGIMPATVASAQALSDQDKARLTQSMERYTGNKLRIAWSVEPKLIGGIVFRFRDLLVDGSLREGLEDLRRRMMGTTLARN